MEHLYLLLRHNGIIERIITPDFLDLKTIRESVGGYFETFWIDEENLVLGLANEEGSLLELPLNFYFPNIYGNILVCKKQGMEMVGLLPEDFYHIKRAVRGCE